MIVVHRVENESIVIDEDIVLTVIEVMEDEVRLRIDHPTGVKVHRQEVYEVLQSQARTEAESGPRV